MAKTIKTTILHRSEKLDRAAVNVDARTVELSFSSEQPVKRYFGMEILDHSAASVDLSRLNAGGAVLVDHDTSDQIGVVENARIDGDRKGRATVRFGKSARAQEIFQDVVDGIRSLVSVGYRVNKMVTEKVEEGLETLRATQWQPMEISLVSIPADTTVGVGRGTEQTFETEIEDMKRSILLDLAPAGAPIVGATGGGAPATNDAREINAMATRLATKIPNIRTFADEAIQNGLDVETFRSQMLEKLPEAQPIAAPAKLEIKSREWKRYSITRAISMLANPNGKLDGFEKEVSDELSLKRGIKPQGLFMPDEAMVASVVGHRSYVAATGTLGAMLIDTDNLGDQFIPLLRNRARVVGLGARVLNLSNPVTIPRQNAAGATNFVGETVASTIAAGNFTQITLTPQAVSGFQQYSKQLLMESNPSIDALIRDDIMQEIALKIDLAALHGGASASGASTGIAGTSGIGSVALSSNGLALANTTAYPAMVSLETLIAAANADVETMGYLMRAGHRGALKTSARFASSDTPVWETNNTVNGYRAEVTQQISTILTTGTATTICSAIFFGDWNQLIIANFGATDLVVDPYTLAVNGVVRIIARRWFDIGVRQPGAFSILGGILTT